MRFTSCDLCAIVGHVEHGGLKKEYGFTLVSLFGGVLDEVLLKVSSAKKHERRPRCGLRGVEEEFGVLILQV